jgi:hypothetical protein
MWTLFDRMASAGDAPPTLDYMLLALGVVIVVVFFVRP